MSLRFPIALVLSIVCLATPTWADFQAGDDAANRGDYETVFRVWRPLAENGDAQAQVILGWLYINGQGVSQDYVQGRQWYEKAAAQGDASGQNSLGSLYYKGLGVPHDYVKAREWFEKSAAQKFAAAQYNLGVFYANGRGRSQDDVCAYMWFSLAIEHSRGYSISNVQQFAADNLDILLRRMTRAQIVEAQRLAWEWEPNKQCNAPF